MRDEGHLTEAAEGAIRRRIDRATARMRLVMLWERLWPRLVPPLVVAGLFVLASWLGLWPGLPDWLRLAALVLFAIAGLVALVPLVTLRMPAKDAALSRLERTGGVPHRPATAVLDRLAPGADSQAQAIWAAHRRKLLAGFGELRAGAPSPGLARRDPYGFRFLLLLLLVVALIATGGSLDRIGDAFRGGGATAAETVAARIDAWAEPPAYTGRPSIFLTGNIVRDDGAPIVVPAGTEVFIRLAGGDADALAVAGDNAPTEAPRLGEGPREFRAVLESDGGLAVVNGARQVLAWTFAVIPDTPPEIAFVAGPARANGGGLQTGYRFADDYGIAAARGEIALAGTMPGARPLVGPPAYALAIPRTQSQEGEATTVRDLTGHPWAGLEVDLTLVATDAAGQEGRSETRRTVLPGRAFTDPIAIALIGERQLLALDASRAGDVGTALDAIAAAAAEAIDAGDFLALRSVRHRLALADNDDELRGVLDYLWEIAVALEGDPAADALAALEDAAEALRQAIEQGASDAEIAALTEALREAMGAYLLALAANMPERQAQPAANVDGRTLRPEDLEEMMDQLQELTQIGAVDAAQQLLDQMQQMMQNLEIAQPREGIERQIQPGGQQLDDLGYLMQEQQRLLDETFALLQDQNAPLPAPQTDAEAEQLMQQLREMRADQQARAEDLQRQQRTLEALMEQLIERLATDGLDPLALPDAVGNMREAAERLGEGRPGLAVDDQTEALEQMRAVAEALAEQVAEGLGGPIGDEGRQDPLGRTLELQGQRYGDNVAVPDEIERQLARQILEIIRQRLEELGRPAIERDYLERLLELY